MLVLILKLIRNSWIMYQISFILLMIFGIGSMYNVVFKTNATAFETWMIGLIIFLILYPFGLQLKLWCRELLKKCLLRSVNLETIKIILDNYVENIDELKHILESNYCFMSKNERRMLFPSIILFQPYITVIDLRNKLIIRLCLFVSFFSLMMVWILIIVAGEQLFEIDYSLQRCRNLLITTSTVFGVCVLCQVVVKFVCRLHFTTQ